MHAAVHSTPVNEFSDVALRKVESRLIVSGCLVHMG